MIRRIARKELLEISRDGRYRVMAAVVLALSLLSLAVGWTKYADLTRQHETAQAATRAQWLNQDKKNPHSAAHYGMYAFKPTSQLAMIDTGIDPYVGVAVWMEAHKQNEFKFRPAQDRTAVQRFGEMTGAEVLQVLLPLFIVLMTFAAFTGEREQGTLRQLMSLGVPPRALAAGKAAGTAAALGLVLLPATVIGVVAFTWSSGSGLLGSDLSRVAGMVAVYLVYFAALTAIGLAVSATAKSSRVSLIVLLTFWFANGLVVTRAASDVAAALHPTPSAVQFQRALDQDLSNPQEMARRLDVRRAALFKEHNVDHVDALPIAFSGVSLQEGEEYANEVFDRHFGGLFTLYERQNQVLQLAGLAAPMLAVRSLSMGLAGTDFNQHRDFVGAAEQYRRGIQRVMNGDIAVNQKKGQVYLADQSLWQKVPDFEYTAPPTSWVLGKYSTSVMILAGWLLAAVVLLSRATSRLRVE
jgi:ABC-2 type transport system permease protein